MEESASDSLRWAVGRRVGVDVRPSHRAGRITDARRALGAAVVVLEGLGRMVRTEPA